MTGPITLEQIQPFVAAWYHALDVHAPVDQCLALLAEPDLYMQFPEMEIRDAVAFRRWYRAVTHLFFDEVHTVQRVEVIGSTGTQAKLAVTVGWQASWWTMREANSRRIILTSKQAWTVRRCAPNRNLFGLEIVEYRVPQADFEFAPDSASLPPPAAGTLIASEKAPSANLVDVRQLLETIDTLDLLPEERLHVRHRWLQMLLWWNDRSRTSKRWFFAFRSLVLVGGVLIPALVSLQTSALLTGHIPSIQVATIVVGLVVAFAAGLEEIWHFGEVWREKRVAAELIKVEGWRFFQLTGPYRGRTHGEAYPDFAANVEALIEREIKDYVAAVQPQPGEREPVGALIDERIKAYLRALPERQQEAAGKPAP